MEISYYKTFRYIAEAASEHDILIWIIVENKDEESFIILSYTLQYCQYYIP